MQRPLSSDYQSKLMPISIEGVTGFVWKRDLLLDFLKSEESNYYAILGGDVIRVLGNKMEYTYDNWSVAGPRLPSESFQKFAARCKEQTCKYVTAYPLKDDIVFKLVISSEVTAGL